MLPESKLLKTADGSNTLHMPEWNEHYHSKHGALQEALHVYIESGLLYAYNQDEQKPIKVLEFGFGTGLNALLSFITAKKNNIKLSYTGVEAFPISKDLSTALNYGSLLEHQSLFKQVHNLEWDKLHVLDGYGRLEKKNQLFSTLSYQQEFDVIYYDAFGPRVQPDLWEEESLAIASNALVKGGVLTTYCCAGKVKRALVKVGFDVYKILGPPGKREMIRAIKL